MNGNGKWGKLQYFNDPREMKGSQCGYIGN